MRIAIVGGTGVGQLGEGLGLVEMIVATPYGEAQVGCGAYRGREVVFLARHGVGHAVPPHRINYRANVAALRQLGCERVIATNAVGSIREHMPPGDLVLPDQFIDFTRMRASTFHDGGTSGVRHVDVSDPYCPRLRELALDAAAGASASIHHGATMAVTDGPRFETPAEIRMFAMLGGDLVGMTGVPEVVLAREAGMCYMSLCVVTNLAAGIKGEPLTEGEVGALMRERLPLLQELVLRVVETTEDDQYCRCRA